MSDYLLDTNIIIDCLRGDPRKKEMLTRLVSGGSLLHSCDVTVAEVFSGMREEEKRATESFMGSLRYLSVEEEEAKVAGELRRIYRAKGRQITLADAMIASLAMNQNLVLLTDNVKDYPMPELRKEKP